MLVVVAAALYASYVTGRTRGLRAHQVGLLGSSAEHVEKILDTVLRNVANLARDRHLSTLDAFSGRQPFLRIATETASGAAYETTTETAAVYQLGPRGLRVGLAGIGTDEAPIEVELEQGAAPGVLGTLVPRAETAATLIGRELTLANFDERLEVVLPVPQYIDPAAWAPEADKHRIAIEISKLDLAEYENTLDLELPSERSFDLRQTLGATVRDVKVVDEIKTRENRVVVPRIEGTLSDPVEISPERWTELGLAESGGELTVDERCLWAVTTHGKRLFTLEPDQWSELQLEESPSPIERHAARLTGWFQRKRIEFYGGGSIRTALTDSQKKKIRSQRDVILECDRRPVIITPSRRRIPLSEDEASLYTSLTDSRNPFEARVAVRGTTKPEGGHRLDFVRISEEIDLLGVELPEDVVLKKVENKEGRVRVTLSKGAPVGFSLTKEQRRRLDLLLGDWRSSTAVVLERLDENSSWHLSVSATQTRGIRSWTLDPDVDLPAEPVFLGGSWKPGRRLSLSFARAPGGAGKVPADDSACDESNGECPEPDLGIAFDVLFAPILETLPLERYFDSYMVADQTGRVLHTHREPGTADLHLRALGQLDEINEENGEDDENEASAIVEFLGLGRLDYEVFCQPIRVAKLKTPRNPAEESFNLKLCGLSNLQSRRRAAFSVSPHVAGVISLLTLLSILSIPFLRFAILEPTERLKRHEVLFLFVGAFFVLFSMSIVVTGARYWIELRSEMDRQLQTLSEDVSTSLASGLTAVEAQLRRWDEEACVDYDASWLDHPPLVTDLLTDDEREESGLDLTALTPTGGLSYKHSVFWIDHEGDQIAKGTTRGQNTQVVPVRERQYFRSIVEGWAWPTHTDTIDDGQSALPEDGMGAFDRPHYYQPIRSITTGELSAVFSMESVISRPRQDACGGEKKSEDPIVVAMSGTLPAFESPVVTPPFGFAIIDSGGTVRIHSDPRQAGFQNLLDQLTEPDRLHSILLSDRSPAPAFDVDYLGRPHRFYATQTELAPWWIVTYYDAELPATLLVEASALSLVPGAAYIALMLVFVVLFRDLLTRNLWPDASKKRVYRNLLVLHFLAVAILGVCLFASPGIVPVSIAPLLAIFVPPMALYATLSILDRVSVDPSREAPVEVGEPLPATNPVPASFTVGLVLIWLLVATLPASVFFEVSWKVELAALARLQGRTVESRVAERDARIAREIRRIHEAPTVSRAEYIETGHGLFRLPTGARVLAQRLPSGKSRRDLLAHSALLGHLSRSWPIYNASSRDLRYEVRDEDAYTTLTYEVDNRPATLAAQDRPDAQDAGGKASALLGRLKGLLVPDGPTISAGNWLATVVLWVIVVLILWKWVACTTRYLCFIGIKRTAEPPVDRVLADPQTMTAVISSPEQEREFTEHFSESEHTVWRLEEEMPTRPNKVILVKNLDEVLRNAETRETRRAQLRELAEEEAHTVIILSYAQPEELVDQVLGNGTDEAGKELHSWLELFSRIQPVIVGLDPGERVRAYYPLWTRLTRREKIAILHIAEEGFLNRKMRAVALRLMRRGLLTESPGLILREHLHNFVVNHQAVNELRDHEERAEDSSWQGMQTAIALTLTAVVALVFVLQEGVLVHMVTGMAGVGGAVAAAFRVINLLDQSRG